MHQDFNPAAQRLHIVMHADMHLNAGNGEMGHIHAFPGFAAGWDRLGLSHSRFRVVILF